MARWQQVVSLCGVLLAYQVQVPGAFAERFEVDRADDDPAASACTAEVNDCTLRGAVLAAHADMTQAHTIVIREGQYLLSLRGAGEDEAATGDLDIRTDVQIIGAGARQTVILSSRIDPITDDRVFHVHAGGSLTLRDLAVRSGRSNGGGALRAERDSSARLERLIVSGNEAVDGGGIFMDGSLIATESTISGNSATSGGGGLYVGMNAAGIDLRQVTISENSAVTGAGALIDGGEAMLRRSTIASNRASGA
ncbi:MAG: hypothetical protein ACKVVP_02740, partial [Chloroflexota bacterium]